MEIKTINSPQHPIVKRLIKLRTDRRFRNTENSVVIEGIKPVSEVCKEYLTKNLVVSQSQLIPADIEPQNIYLFSDALMKKVSGMESPEGIIAEIEKPSPVSLEGYRNIIALDRINDPANMGMLLRTALALGWDAVFILNNSCDMFNEKALRAARGATFRLPFFIGSWEHLKELIQKQQFQAIVADIEGGNPTELSKATKRLLVLGNEAQGASQEALDICQRISIPMSGKMESLNVSVAGGILMYLLRPL